MQMLRDSLARFPGVLGYLPSFLFQSQLKPAVTNKSAYAIPEITAGSRLHQSSGEFL